MSQKIGILDYRAGNLTSVKHAVAEVGAEGVISDDHEFLLSCDRLIFPGVGAARASMENLRNLGLDQVLRDFTAKGRPILGICVGAQIILDLSEEDGDTACLGLLPGRTRKFVPTHQYPIKVPHMGWNQVEFTQEHPLFAGIPNGSTFYFVHSFYPVVAQPDFILAETLYGGTRFTSVLNRGNLAAVQFHAEKSGRWGLQLIANFLEWSP